MSLIKTSIIWSFVRGDDLLPEEMAERIHTDNFLLRFRLTRVACLIGSVVAMSIASDFYLSTYKIQTIESLSYILFNYLILFLLGYGFQKYEVISAGKRYFFNFMIFSLGVSWSIFLSLLFLHSNAEQQILLFSIYIGLISTTISTGPLSSTLPFWFSLTIGLYCSLYLAGYFYDLAYQVCLFAYSALIFFTMIFLNRKMLERAVSAIRLSQNNETIRILLRDFEENASDWLWETGPLGEIKHVSARFAEVARQPAAAIGGDLFGFMAGDDNTLRQSRDAAGDVFEPLRRRVAARKPFRDMVMPVNMGGERRWWSMTGKPVTDDNGAFIGYRGVGSDVTAMHRSRERIAYLARHDTLTDLANRTEFNSTLSQLLSEDSKPNAALLCLDLDQFKAVNDSYGHGLGDSVLRAVAHRIRGAIRDRDVAARLGGDEFSIVLPSNDEFEATAVADRVIDRVARPYKFEGVTVEIGVSIGIALAPRDGITPEELYRNADLALYRAKDSGRGTWRLFDRTMDRHLEDRRGLQRDIKRALRDGQLFVEFQPVVALADRAVVGLEALVRWCHPERGVIAPTDFIGIAERSGLIGAVTAFVLSEAAALVARLPDPISVSVNLSPLHLREAWMVDQLGAIIEAAGIASGRIEFEVTESAVLETEGRSLDNLHRLHALGCRIAIDDFGTGYSSLATLRRFPFDRLKIDRGFIDDLERTENDAPIVKAVIDLSQTLGLRVTAEGIETERHASILKSYRCNDGQGYLFSAPLRAEEVMVLFRSGSGVPICAGGAPSAMEWPAAPAMPPALPVPQHSPSE